MKSSGRTSLLVAGSAMISGAITVATVSMFGPAAQGWLLAARYTARYSFATFLVAFLGPRWIPARLAKHEGRLILAFGAAHTVHLGVLITYRTIAGTLPAADALAVGGIGYALMAALLIITARGGRAVRLKNVALHYLLFVFALTYALKIPNADQQLVGVAATVTCAGALAARHLARRPAIAPLAET